MENLTGKQFKDYKVMASIAEGGMAAVYKAYQPHLDRTVAVKVLPRQYALEHQFVERFRREAKTLAKLQHPRILPIYDYGIEGEYFFLVMPFIEGGDLTHLMKKSRLTLEQIGPIVTQVGDALDFAHTQGVIHRDLKPNNILMDQRGNCFLSDFGLAKIAEESSSKLTSSGLIVGTADYMSPEQGLGQVVDSRTDIYSFGVILYELVTGQVPFKAETPTAVIIKTIQEPLRPPRDLNPDLPEAIEEVILVACAKQPDDRFATVHELVQAFQAALQETPPDIRQSSAPEDVVTVSSLRRRLRPQDASDLVPVQDTRPHVSPDTQVDSRINVKPAPLAAAPPQNRPADSYLMWVIVALLVLLIVLVSVAAINLINRPEEVNPDPPTSPANATAPIQLPGGGPPQAAFTACQDVPLNEVCSFTSPQGDLFSGTCQTIPSSTEPACVPINGQPQPGP